MQPKKQTHGPTNDDIVVGLRYPKGRLVLDPLAGCYPAWAFPLCQM